MSDKNSFTFLKQLLIFAAFASALLTPLLSEAVVQVHMVDNNSGGSITNSLRYHIDNAASGDTIVFGPGVTSPIDLSTNGELLLNKDLTIAGPGARDLTIKGPLSGRIFNNHSGNSKISGLTLSGGSATEGGAILNDANLNLSNVTIKGNSASSKGGAVFNHGTLAVYDSTITNNSAASGGAIYNETGKNLIINNSTFSNNSSSQGGAITNNGTLRLFNATITENTSGGSSAAVDGTGNVLTIKNSIIAGNTGPDIQGIQTGSVNNLTGTSPQLVPLTNNGGPTDTFYPQPGSVAINYGDPLSCLSTDQRGVSRLRQGGCDTGSVEAATLLSFPSTSTTFIATLAGYPEVSGTSNSTDGTGATARFHTPAGTTTDGTYLYIADSANHAIRKMEISTGNVTTIAGYPGTPGNDDGSGSAARFDTPSGIVYDRGLLFVTDTGNHTLRMIDLANLATLSGVTTIAGAAGSPDNTDAIGTAARFYAPAGLALYQGQLYISELGNHTIRKCSLKNYAVTTFAGTTGATGSDDDYGTAAKFNSPYGLAVGGEYLYVADSGNNRVREIKLSSGWVHTIPLTLNNPKGLYVDGPHLYLSDTGSNTVQMIVLGPTPVLSTIAGTSSGSNNGTADTAKFSAPYGLTGDGTALYVADSANHTIRRIAFDNTPPTDGTLTAVAGNGSVFLSWSGFSDPSSIVSYKLASDINTGISTPAGCSTGSDIGNVTNLTVPAANGTTNFYRVCAVDGTGNVSAGATNSATPSGSIPMPLPFTETFNDGALPSGWSLANNGSGDWQFSTTGNATGGTFAYATVSPSTWGATLQSPAINMSSATKPTLEFKTNSPNDVDDFFVEISTNGTDWTAVWSNSGTAFTAKTVTVDLSPAVGANKSSVSIRFRYVMVDGTGNWSIDDVKIYEYSPVPMADALNNPSNPSGLTFTTGGNAYWFGQSAVTKDGTSAAQSGLIADEQVSWLQTSKNFSNPTMLSFWWTVSSEQGWDYLRFYVDGIEQAAISGAVDLGENYYDPLPWEQRFFQIPSGSHTLKWEYSKDSSGSTGADAGWVDQIELCEGSYNVTPSLITTGFAGGSSTVTVTPVSGTCAWGVNTPSWLTATPSSGGGSTQTVNVTIAPGPELFGKISIAGQDVMVKRVNYSGGLDSSFNPNPGVYNSSPSSLSDFIDIGRQSDGRIIALGTANNVANAASAEDIALLRFNADGSLDETFASSTGKAVWDSGGTAAETSVAIAVQPDDKIVVLSSAFNSSTTKKDMILLRFTPNGMLDIDFTTGFGADTGGDSRYGYLRFAPDSGISFIPKAAALQQDGRIVIAGYSETASHTAIVARFLNDGTPDTSFGSMNGFISFTPDSRNASAQSVLIQPDGKIVFAGKSYAFDGESISGQRMFVARLLDDGALDTSSPQPFKSGYGFFVPTIEGDTEITSLALQGESIIAGGQHVAADTYSALFARIGSTGAMDPNFGSGGTFLYNNGPYNYHSLGKLLVLPDNSIVAAVYRGNEADSVTLHYDTNGAMDTSFGNGGITALRLPATSGTSPASMLLQPDNKLVMVGYNWGSQSNGFIVRQNISSFTATPGSPVKFTSTVSSPVQSRLININNHTDVKLSINSITISAGGSDFSFSIANGATCTSLTPEIPAGSSCSVSVNFAPSSDGAKSGILSISSSAPEVRTILVALEGVATGAVNAALGDPPGLTFTTGGDAPWFAQTSTTYNGVSAMQSGDIGPLQSSWLETTVTGPTDLLFVVKVWGSALGNDYRFYIDGALTDQQYNYSDWTPKVYSIGAGTHTVRWEFAAGSFSETGYNAWLGLVATGSKITVTPSTTGTGYGYIYPNTSFDWVTGVPTRLTLDPDDDNRIDTPVGGTCPVGTISGNLYGITGQNNYQSSQLTGNCTIEASFSLIPPIDGVCGGSAGSTPFNITAPPADLCATGSSSFIWTDSANWKWSCSGQYSGNQADCSAPIDKLSQTITFNTPPPIPGDSTFYLSPYAYASSGLPLSVTLTNPVGATAVADGSILFPKRLGTTDGTIDVIVSQGGNDFYYPASDAGDTLTITTPQAAGAPGTLDVTFNPAAVTPDIPGVITGIFDTSKDTAQVLASARQADNGKIVVAGFDSYTQLYVKRFHGDGSVDTSFTPVIPSEFLYPSEARAVAVQSDGKVLVAGTYLDSEYYDHLFVLRYLQNGSLDITFGNNGLYSDSWSESSYSLAIDNVGNILVAGDAIGGGCGEGDYVPVLLRLTPNGQLDTSFGYSGYTSFSLGWGEEAHARAIVIDADNRIVVAGYNFVPGYGYGDTGTAFLWRFDNTGYLTDSLALKQYGDVNTATNLAIQGDGSIIATGYNINSLLVWKILSSWGPDNSFGSGGMTSYYLEATPYTSGLALLDRGRFAVGSTLQNSTLDAVVLGFDSTGNLDSSFGSGGLFTYDRDGTCNEAVSSLIAQPDNRIVAAGTIGACTGNAFLLRLNGPLQVLAPEVTAQEDFTGGKPEDWSAVDPNYVTGWRFDDPGNRGNHTGGSGTFAIADGAYFSGNGPMDAVLTTPSYDLSSRTTAWLEFKTDFNANDTDTADVDIKVGSGVWVNVWRKTGNIDGNFNGTVQIDITALAAGQSDVKIRFHYYNSYEGWWQVDDVTVHSFNMPALTVTKAGFGSVSGRVISSLAGIDCGSSCSANFKNNSIITLTPSSTDPAYTFTGWGGDCSGIKSVSCTLTMDAAKNVIANFSTMPTAPAITWAESLDNGSYDYNASAQPTADGGYVLAGISTFGYNDVWVAKFDQYGSALWQKTYANEIPYPDNADGVLVRQTADNGFIVAGKTYSPNFAGSTSYSYNIWLLKLSPDGDVEHEMTYDAYGDDEFAYDLQQTADGGYIVIGRTYNSNYGSPDGDGNDLLIIRTDADLNMLWQKSYGRGYDEEGRSIQQTRDGGFILAGTAYNDIWLMKLGPSGNILWEKTFDNDYSNDSASSVQQTTDNGYIVAGSSDGRFWILKLDQNAEWTWSYTYNMNNTEYASSIRQTMDGGYIVTGQNCFDIWLLKLDQYGSVQWQKAYGDGYGYSYAHEVSQTVDGGYIIGGYSEGSGDYWLIKVDKDGNLANNLENGFHVTDTSDSFDAPYEAYYLNINSSNGTNVNQYPLPNTNFFQTSAVVTNTGVNVIRHTSLNIPISPTVLDNSAQTFVTSGDQFWFAQTATVAPGGNSAALQMDGWQGGARPIGIQDNQSGWVETAVTGPGTLSFWWKVSSESNKDYLGFTMDPSLGMDMSTQPPPNAIYAISGDVDWQEKTFEVPAGQRTLRWTYARDGSGYGGSDSAWLDQVVFTPYPSYSLGVTISGNGTVRSSVVGIDCGSSCTANYTKTSVITLTATPDVSPTATYFTGWTGDACNGNISLTCMVTMESAKSVTATFTTSPPTVQPWAEIMGGSYDEEAVRAFQTSDGGYLAVGYQDSYLDGSGDAWVMKYHADGSLDWEKSIGTGSYEWINDARQTADGGYILTGQTYRNGTSDGWVVKLFSNGSVDWSKSYGGDSYDSLNSIQQTADGGYIATGYTESFGSGSGDAWALKLDKDGIVTWKYAYNNDYTHNSSANSVLQTTDGGYIIAGQFYDGVKNNAWLLKLNSNGSKGWDNTYGGTSWDNFSSVQQTIPDGGYIAVGSNYSFGSGDGNQTAWVVKLDNSGVITWQNIYNGGPANSSYANSIQQTADNGYIVSGSFNNGSNGNDIWLMKLTSGGSVGWQKTYGSSRQEYANSVQNSADGGFIVAGVTDYYDSYNDGYYDAFLLKLDASGDVSSCQPWLQVNSVGLPGATATNAITAGSGPIATVEAITSLSVLDLYSDTSSAATGAKPGGICGANLPLDGTLFASPGNHLINLSWSGFSGDIDHYRLATCNSGFDMPAYCTSGTDIGSGTSYTQTNADPNQTYYYRLCAVKADGTTTPGVLASAMPIPDPPGGVTATAGNAQAVITWNAVPGATSYNIYRSAIGSVLGTVIGSSSTTAYIDTTAANGTTYYYAVTGLIPGAETTASAQASATPQASYITTLASVLNISSGLALDDAYIYWAEESGAYPYYQYADDGIIKKVGINGGALTSLVSGLNHAVSIAVDASSVYFVERGNWPTSNGTVKKLAKNDSTLTTLTSGLLYSGGIAIDSSFVYFGLPAAASIDRVSINGGSQSTFYSASCSWCLGPMATDNTNLYWPDGFLHSISQKAKVGEGVTTLATGLAYASSIATDSSYVYWTDQDNGLVQRTLVGGGTITPLASGLNNPNAIALDATSVYVLESGVNGSNYTGSIKQVPLGGGTATTLASGLNTPNNILADAANIYWQETAASGASVIKKMPKSGGTAGPTCSAMPLSPALLPAGSTWFAYNQVIAAGSGGAPFSYQITGGALPPGLSFGTDGTLTGTPSTPGQYNFTITATDNNGCVSVQSYSLPVSSAAAAMGSNNVTFAGGSGSVNVTDSNSSNWSAVSASPWLTITSPVGGTGNGAGTVAFSAAPGPELFGSIKVAGFDLTVPRTGAAGALDPTFNPASKGYNYLAAGNGISIKAAVQQPDGKTVVTGTYTYLNGTYLNSIFVARYNANGTLDTSFGTRGGWDYIPVTDGYQYSLSAVAIGLQSDGSIIVAGDNYNNHSVVVRFDQNGILDPTFGGSGAATYTDGAKKIHYQGLAVQPDDSIVVTGFTYESGIGEDLLVVRFDQDGSLDNTFNGTGAYTYNGASYQYGRKVAIQPDLSIVVAGDSGTDNLLLRLLPDGTLDPAFVDGEVLAYSDSEFTFHNNFVTGLALQTDGSILTMTYFSEAINGDAEAYGYNYYGQIFRHTAGGTLDTSFGTNANGIVTYDLGHNDNTTGPLSGSLNGLALQSDGKIVVAGGLDYDLDSELIALRYTNAGALDPTFGSNGLVKFNKSVNSNELANTVIAQADDKLVIAGSSSTSGIVQGLIMRLLNEALPVDTTPPTVTTTSPANSDTGIALDSPITITWSEDINCATVTATNITINNGSGWALSSCSANQAVFTTSGQSGLTTYTVTVGTEVKDLAGNAMASGSSWSFTTVSPTFTITPSAEPGGSISPSSAQTVNYNSSQSFTITPDPGYHVADVLVDGSSVGAVTSYDFTTVTTNHTISASFALDANHTVTPSAGTGGSISPNTAQTVAYNGTTAFTVTPDSGYYLYAVTGCGGKLVGNTYTTGVVTADCAVSATFAAVSGGLVINEYPVLTSSSNPGFMTVGPDGNIWFTELAGNKIGRITPSGVVTEFTVPTSGSEPRGITAGPDGNLWFLEAVGKKIGRITTSGVITEYSGLSVGSFLQSITAGPDGNLWFTNPGSNKIGRITTAGVITEFPITTPGSGPNIITVGPDGNLWFTEQLVDKIGRITTSGVITEYPGLTFGSTSAGMTAGPDGNLWFTESEGNKIGRITTSGGITEYAVPTSGSAPNFITSGPDGNLWFTESEGNKIGRITTSGVFTEYTIPTSGRGPCAITAGPDGNLWFTEYNGNKIGQLILGSVPNTVIPSAGAGGSISPNSVQTVNTYGSTSFTITPDSGYHIADVLVDDSSVGAVTNYTFTNVRENHTISASFAATDSTSPTAAISYSSAGPYKALTAVTITATFSEQMADALVPMIALSGSDTLAATAMTKADATHYTYNYSAGSGNGTVNVTLSNGTDIVGNGITPTPTSGGSFSLDTTPPTVTATSPANGATGIALNSNVTITWSEDINCTTVTTTNITINNGSGWTLSSCSANQAVFTPSGQSGLTTYTVTVGTEVKDLAGNAMASSYPSSYTTAAGIKTWVGGTGTWSTDTKWSPIGVPTTGDDVFINVGSGYTVTLDMDPTVNSLTLGNGGSSIPILSANGRTLTITSASTVATGATLNLTGSTVSGGGTLTNQGTINLTSSTINTALNNGGTVNVYQANALTGALTTQAGSLLHVEANNGTQYDSGYDTSFMIANGFTNNGTIELTNKNNSYNKTATLGVTSGILVNASGGSINSLGGGYGSRVLTAEVNNQGTITASWPLTINKASAVHTNSGTINVNSTLTLSGATSFTNNSPGIIQGTSTFDPGTATFSNTGTIAGGTVGTAGKLTFSGNITPGTGSINIDIGGPTPITDYDQIAVTGTATLSGTLNVSLINTFDPPTGSSFTIISCGTSCTGSFTTTNLPALTNGKSWIVSYGANAVTLTVQGPQTISSFVPPTTVTYGVAPITLSATGGPSTQPVTYSLVSGPGTLSGTNNSTLTITGAGTINLKASQAGDATYSAAADLPASITVNPATLTVTGMTATSRQYDGTTNVTFSGGTLVGILNSDSVSIQATAGSFTDKNVGTTKPVTVSSITLTGAQAGNYIVTNPTGITADINPAPLSITANSNAKIYGQSITFTGTEFYSSGLQNGETISSVALASAGALSSASAGSYPITVSAPSGGTFSSTNYSTTYNSGILTVTQMIALPITFDPAPILVYGGPDGTISARANSGQPVIFLSLTPGICTISGNTVTPVTAGTCAVDASEAPSTNIIPAQSVRINIIVNKATPIITWAAPDAIIYGTALSTTQLNALASLPGTITYTPTIGTFLNAGIHTLSITFIPTDTANVSSTTATTFITIAAKPLTVTGMTATSRAYDGTTGVTLSGGTLGGIIGSDLVSIDSSFGSFVDKNAGLAKPVLVTYVMLIGPDAGNYLVTNPTGLTAAITSAPLAIIANSFAKIYGQTHTFTGTEFTSVGLITGETIGAVTLASAGAAATATTAGGPYPITVSAATGGTFTPANYAITYTPGALSITQTTVTILATASTGGTITPAGTSTVNLGADQAYTITPDSGYIIADVKVDGISKGAVSSYSFSSVSVSHAIEVQFIRPDGVLDPTNNTGAPRINDALIALSFALGEAVPTPEQLRRGDTSPMINGVPHPDGRIDLADVLVILRKVVGLNR